MSWRPSHTRSGVVIYNFDARHPHELSLEVGDVVHISEECAGYGWYKGYSIGNRNKFGIFPCNYVHVKVSGSGASSSCVKEEAIVAEVADVLRVWGDALKKSYAELRGGTVHRLDSSMTLLVKWRRDLVLGSMRSDHLLRVKSKIAAMINKCNIELGLDVVARDENFDAVDVDSVSVLDLYNIHSQPAQIDAKETTVHRFVHLYANVSSVSCQVSGEDTELLLSLYDAGKQEFVSERMMVRFGADGAVQNTAASRDLSLSWLFTDLDSSVLEQLPELYIVGHVLRLGRMDLSVKKPTTSIFRRPVGCVVLPLAKLRAVRDEAALPMVQINSHMYPLADDKDLSVLHDQVIRRIVKPSERSGAICLNVQLIYGDLRYAVDSHPGLLSKELFLVRKLGFAAHTIPGEMRNDIFVTVERGDFEKGGKSSAKNIEVCISLMDVTGAPLDMMLQSASSAPTSELQTVILYHNNSPRWGEPFRVNIPLHLIPHAVLVFSIRHCSSTSGSRAEKQGIFSYLRLVAKDGTTIQNGLHELCLYRYSPNCFTPAVFLTGPATANEFARTGTVPHPLVLSKKEGFAVSVKVCSTKLTQDPRLLALLQWRMHQDRLVEVLEGLMNMDGRGVCLFMQDAFDALFYILDKDNKLCNQLVFNALVHFLNYLLQPEYEMFVETLNKYISVHFSGAMAYKKLLTGLRGYIDKSHRRELRPALLDTMRCFHYIFKIVIQSRQLHARASRSVSTTPAFKESVEKVILSLTSLIKGKDAELELQPVQCAALKSLSESIDMLQEVFSAAELAQILSSIIDVIDHPLLETKLSFILSVIGNALFTSLDARRILLPIIIANVTPHLSAGSCPPSIVGAIGQLVTRLESPSCLAVPEDGRLLWALLPRFVEYITERVAARPKSAAADSSLAASMCSLLGILRLMDTDIYADLIPTLPEADAFIARLFSIFSYLLGRDVFDKSWSSLRLIMHNIILVAIVSLAETLRPQGEETAVNVELMKAYFTLATQFITQAELQLEALHPIRAHHVRARFGDMRYVMATEVVVMWSELGDARTACIPSLTRPLLEAALVQQDEVRSALLPLFVDLLELDYAAKGSIRAVSHVVFSALDPLIKAGGGDYAFLSAAEEIWLGLVEKSATLPDAACTLIRGLVRRVVLLATQLIDYRALGKEDRSPADRRRRMQVLHTTLVFYRQHGPHRLYDTCLYKLARLHILEGGFTEAAFTLLRISQSLDFKDTTPLDAVLEYPTQTACSRREALFQDMVEYFGRGKSFECGIEQCDELIALYRHQLYDYNKLRTILSKQATFFGNIVEDHRPAREYFRVGYYGHGLPRFLRNRTFIYRGLEYEKLQSFQDRILEDNGIVNLMKTNEVPGKEITSSPKGYLQICTVKPCPVIPPQFASLDTDERVRDYYNVNNITRFEYSRPFHKGAKDKDNEFKSLWLERTSLTIEWPLPGIMAWAEISDTKVTEISPINNAVETMIAKNKELQNTILSYRNKQTSSINPLSMALNGVIDAAVMGGTENYEKAFFIASYLEENPQDAAQVEHLQRLMREQVGILEKGLKVHQELAPDNLQPFHTKMEASFALLKEKDLLKGGSSEPRRSVLRGTPVAAPRSRTPDYSLQAAPHKLPRGDPFSRTKAHSVRPKVDEKSKFIRLQSRRTASRTMNGATDGDSPA